jgi:hypothetical protein
VVLFPAICLHRLVVKPRRGHEPQSDTSSAPWLINEALAAHRAVVAAVLLYARLPWGVSLVGVAERV